MKKEDEKFKPIIHYQDEKDNCFVEFSKEDPKTNYKNFITRTNKFSGMFEVKEIGPEPSGILYSLKISMKKILKSFTPSKQDLFSIQSTLLSIFTLLHFEFEVGLLFIVIVALYTIGMDQIYKACR